MITPGTLRRQAQKGIAFRTPAMPGLRATDEHARQRNDTVRASVATTPIGTADPLRKAYGKAVARGDLSFPVDTGQIFSFPGSAGAGTTTAAEMLEGFRHRTAGGACVPGEDPAKAGGDWGAHLGAGWGVSGAEPGLTAGLIDSPESKAEATASSPSYWPAPSRRAQVSAASILTAWRSPGRLASVRDRANR
jgi:hypothetical protein